MSKMSKMERLIVEAVYHFTGNTEDHRKGNNALREAFLLARRQTQRALDGRKRGAKSKSQKSKGGSKAARQ